MANNTCGDCGCKEGQWHELGCDMEVCPFCNGQLLSCMCVYEKLGLIDHAKYTAKTEYLPPAVHRKGISAKQAARWKRILADKGRIPYIAWPHTCARCGARWPDFFMVSDADWEHYIEPGKRDEIVCLPCYREIKRLIDTATLARGETLPADDPSNPDRLTMTPEQYAAHRAGLFQDAP